MSFVWFQNVLAALGKRLNYESISHLYGNSFAKDANKIISAANPLIKTGTSANGSVMDLAKKVKIIKTGDADANKQLAQKTLGDISWATELFKGADSK